MIERIEAVPVSVIEGFIASMPSDWMSEEERRKIGANWSNGSVGKRLAALRLGIGNESLL